MSAQRLNARSIRRIERDVNKDRKNLVDIVMAWSHGGYVMNFVTSEHIHGAWDKKTGLYELDPNRQDRFWCYSTCPKVGESVWKWAEEMRSGER